MSSDSLPECLSQGEVARLFPVISTTSKEGRTTSITLACISKIDELGRMLLASAGQRAGTRAKIDAYTEIVPANLPNGMKARPDGFIVLKVGSRTWTAFVEAKVGNADLEEDQVERYRALAKENDVDCVITISNQFATSPTIHPLEGVRKSRSKIPVIHWSWMYILTTAELLFHRDDFTDRSQRVLLNELRRFLAHDSAGVRGFSRMPKAWTDLNRLVSSGGSIPPKSAEAIEVMAAWHQETRDLSLILSRLTETVVSVKLPRKHAKNPVLRQKDELSILRDEKQLRLSLSIPNAAAPVDVVADLARRSIDVGMTLRAPEDKKSTAARIRWLLRQIKRDDLSDLHVRVQWPGRSAPTQHMVAELVEDVSIAQDGKEHMAPASFHLFHSKRLGARFTQQANFIEELERLVPSFYGQFGSKLVAWVKPAPSLKSEDSEAGDVSSRAISDGADTDAFET